MAKSRIVAAVGVAAVSAVGDKKLSKVMEEAMSEAVLHWMAKGVSLESPEMKMRMLEAKEKARRQYFAEMDKESGDADAR
jgi:hypothetical protein